MMVLYLLWRIGVPLVGLGGEIGLIFAIISIWEGNNNTAAINATITIMIIAAMALVAIIVLLIEGLFEVAYRVGVPVLMGILALAGVAALVAAISVTNENTPSVFGNLRFYTVMIELAIFFVAEALWVALAFFVQGLGEISIWSLIVGGILLGVCLVVSFFFFLINLIIHYYTWFLVALGAADVVWMIVLGVLARDEITEAVSDALNITWRDPTPAAGAEPAKRRLFAWPILPAVWLACAHLFMDFWFACYEIVGDHHPLMWIVMALWMLVTYPLMAVVTVACLVLAAVAVAGWYLTAGVLCLAQLLANRIQQTDPLCQHCQQPYHLPQYTCTCGATHRHMMPGVHGLASHVCTCGERLRLLSPYRQHLDGTWLCPHCQQDLSIVVHANLSIPVVGGWRSGKTCWMCATVNSLQQSAAARHLACGYMPDGNPDDDYVRNDAKLHTGRLPVHDNYFRSKYYRVGIMPKGRKIQTLLTLCEVAGASHDGGTPMAQQMQAEYQGGLVLMVDPLSATQYREDLAASMDIRAYGAICTTLDAAYASTLDAARRALGLTDEQLTQTDVAVVFSKGDIPGLDAQIGRSAVLRYRLTHPGTSAERAQNQVCRRFLQQYAEDDFLQQLSAFRTVRFFTCSALGHTPDGTPFAARDVELPVLWLMRSVLGTRPLRAKVR